MFPHLLSKTNTYTYLDNNEDALTYNSNNAANIYVALYVSGARKRPLVIPFRDVQWVLGVCRPRSSTQGAVVKKTVKEPALSLTCT